MTNDVGETSPRSSNRRRLGNTAAGLSQAAIALCLVGSVGCDNSSATPSPSPTLTAGTPGQSGAGAAASPPGSTSGGAPAPVAGSSGGAGAASNAAGGGGSMTATPSMTAGRSGSDAGSVAAGGGGMSGGPTTTGFMNVAPMMGAPLDPMGKALTPPPPEGWVFHEIQGTKCRDGSTSGLFVHQGTERKLLIFLEGGGACSNAGLCGFNQSNINESFAGDGTTLIGSALGVVQDRQQPGVFTDPTHQGAPAGVFEFANPMNPFKGWSAVYIPYCTGDVHAGTKTGDVPGLTNQNFHGYLNMKVFMSRLVPTFAGKLDRVILTGSSAGSLGAMMNYSMTQDAFGDVHVDLIADSGLPFRDMFWPTCLQKRWRDSWGLNAAMPPDCTECFREDGSGFLEYANFLWRKHPKLRIAALSRTEDEIIRLFYSVGLNNCQNYDTLDPVGATIGGILDPNTLYAGPMFTAALRDVRDYLVGKGHALSSFLIGPPNETNLHQIIFRPEFYTLQVNGKTPAQFVTEFLDGKDQQVE
jgi:Pectinacetylesterase